MIKKTISLDLLRQGKVQPELIVLLLGLQSRQRFGHLSQLGLIRDWRLQSRFKLIMRNQDWENSLCFGSCVEASVSEKGCGGPNDELGRLSVVLWVRVIV